MRTATLATILCFSLVCSSGCVQNGPRPKRADPVVDEIRNQVDRFLYMAGAGGYDGITAIVLARQAKGFRARDFIANRFRMKTSAFRIIGWDPLKVSVTTLKAGPGMLSSAPVTVRVLADNEVKVVFVNLHWQKHGGKWRINAFPGQ